MTEREALCSSARTRKITHAREFTDVYFPGTSPPDYERFMSGKTQFDEWFSKSNKMFSGTFIVCVAYYPAYSNVVHETAISYRVLFSQTSSGQQECAGSFTDGKTPIASPCFIRESVGGSYAN